MNLKLHMASWWTPKSLLMLELDRVAELTTGALDRLLKKHSIDALNKIRKNDKPMKGDITDRRAAMAAAHNARVAALVSAIGVENGIRIGRKSLYNAGLTLGREARNRLGLGSDLNDLIQAARILYRVLGINFEVIHRNGKIILRINHCALANHYSATTCRVLSAADEGVVKGLNPDVNMIFKKHMTGSATECMAELEFIRSKVE